MSKQLQPKSKANPTGEVPRLPRNKGECLIDRSVFGGENPNEVKFQRGANPTTSNPDRLISVFRAVEVPRLNPDRFISVFSGENPNEVNFQPLFRAGEVPNFGENPKPTGEKLKTEKHE